MAHACWTASDDAGGDRMTVQFNRRAVAQVKRDPAVKRALLDDGWKIAELAAQLAPKSAGPGGGAGARSIRAEVAKGTDDDPEIRVSWDRDHFYMAFPELGTEHQPARSFLRAAANRFR